jgi:hypothetical protein
VIAIRDVIRAIEAASIKIVFMAGNIFWFLVNQAFQVNRGIFVLTLAFFLNTHIHPGHTVIVISRIFPLSADQQMFLFINQVLAVIFGHLKTRDQLYSIGGTGLFTKSAVYAP